MYEHFKEQGSLSLDSGTENIIIFARTKLCTYQVYGFLYVGTYQTIGDAERIRLLVFNQQAISELSCASVSKRVRV